MFLRTLLAAAVLAAVAPLQAATLAGSFTADDNLKIYVSNGLTPTAADLIFNKTTSWGTTAAMAGFALPDGQDLYLLVDARNFSGPAMFVADFSLAGSGFTFANGGTTLVTDTVHWSVGTVDFASAADTPFSMGVNAPGLPIWGQRPGISSAAHALWAYNADWANGQPGNAYFVTRLVAEIPEPATLAMWLAGLGLLGAARRRR